MDDAKFRTTIENIVSSIEKAGMDPYSQLYGYLTKGKDEYITRTGNARELIKTLDQWQIWDYVKEMEEAV